MLLHEEGLDDIVVDKLRLDAPPTDLPEWRAVVSAKQNPEAVVDIGMVGKYVQIRDSYISLNEALMHGGIKTRTRVNIHYFESQDIERLGPAALQNMDAILVPGGFGDRGIEGKIQAIRFARENGIPYLGICLGMQLAIIEYARNVLALKGANSTEFDRATNHPVIALITEWQDLERGQQVRDENPTWAAACAWAPRKRSSSPVPWRARSTAGIRSSSVIATAMSSTITTSKN